MCRDGKRASQTTGGTTTSCAYDANVSLPNILTDGTLKYVYGLGLAYAADSSGNLQVYHADGLGSVRAITNGSGAVTQTYTTDEFGVPSQTQGTSTQPFQFTGQQRDSTGLYYLRARMYDPTLGRFLQRDPLFGGLASPLSLNRFSYSMNNPVALVDPSGLSSNQATRDGSSDNDCFTTANGVFGGYVVNAACFDMPMGGQTVYALVDFPPPPHVVATVVFAKPGKGGGGGKAGARPGIR